jgi:hypothetical protein
MFLANLGRTAPRDREGVSVFSVIARSEATKQSILYFCRSMDCFASLAMTTKTFRRGCLKIESVIAEGMIGVDRIQDIFGDGGALPRPVLHGERVGG